MIPVRLQLKNFMSYGEHVPPLDFTGIRIACLSGDNGNGKTVLLDAMTWALFGETRAEVEDDVIRLGATECSVHFDFRVGDTTYRVHKARGKRGGAIWELQIWQEDGSTRSLSGTNARDTRAKIEQILRMDYRTFLASGYLAQGRADSFARATVTERKKVLADILDLDRYDRLEQMAKDRRKEAEDRETDAERELNAIDAELANEAGYRSALDAAQARRGESVSAAELQSARRDALVAEVQRLEERELKAQEFEARIPEIEEEIAVNTRHYVEVARRVDEAAVLVARREAIEQAHAALIALREQIQPLEAQNDAIVALQQEEKTVTARVRDAAEILGQERFRLECAVEALELEARADEGLLADIARLDAERAALGDPEARRRAIESERAAADDCVSDLKAQFAALRAQSTALETRRAALTGSSSALCDYCGQPLPPEKRRAAIEEATAEIAERESTQQKVAAWGRDAKKRVDQLRADLENVQKSLQAAARFEAQRASVCRERERIAARIADLPRVRQQLVEIEGRLARQEYAIEDQARLRALAQRLQESANVGAALQAARARLVQLQSAERDRLQLQAADQVLAIEPTRAAELTAGIEKRRMQIARARRQIADVRAETAALPAQRRAREAVAADLRTIEEQMRVADREIGQYGAQLARCEELKRTRGVRVQERALAAHEKDLYKELAGAFGKKGVQALIIENALPEVETQANDLLAKMTGGALQLRLVTQREARTRQTGGGTSSIETLDIRISDDMGTRPYEMFSGGEAFRINFALRIALSRLLAHRAGAPLQTLILDEGFGTQDPRGREAIVDAIHEVSDSFALILVITHIEELKDAFATRIEVVKGPDGSTFAIA